MTTDPETEPGVGSLAGVHVLDFGRYVAGPWCAQLLQCLGADVVRVERPAGGEDRFLFPISDDLGAYFLHCNRGKRAMTLNPTKPAGREVVARLIKWADVIVANVPDEALLAMGLDWDSVHGANPRAVLATASTFGTTGPYAGRVGFDGIGQVMSGAAYMSGYAGEPMKSFAPWVDYGTASNLAFAVMGALFARQTTGRGCRVEASLLGTALTATGHVLIEQSAIQRGRGATGNRHPAAGPSDLIATLDGHVLVQVVGDAIFARWCSMIGHPELVDDPRFASDDLRGENGPELTRLAGEWCATRTTAQALEEFAAASVPAGPLLSLQQVIDDPHVASAMMERAERDHDGGTVAVIAPPVRLSEGGAALGAHGPALGAHTDQMLRAVGYDQAEIDGLRAARII